MDFHRPKRLMGLFGKRYSTTTTTKRRPSEEIGAEPSSSSSRSVDDSSSDSSSEYSNDDAVAIRRLIEQRDTVAEELRATKENLEKEKKITHELNQKLIMKAISIDCQLAENEEKFSKAKFKVDSANRKNKELTDTLLSVRMENQNLMKRTAALARRDQIQKATIMASNSEIIKLMTTVESFQEKYLTLHDAVVTIKEEAEARAEETENEASIDKTIEDEREDTISSIDSGEDDSVTPFEEDQMSPSKQEQLRSERRAKEEYIEKREEFEAKQAEFKAKQEEFEAAQEEHRKKKEEWQAERNDLIECISKLKSNNKQIKKKFVQTLKKHQWKWHKEKEKLLKKVGDLEVWLEEQEAELLITKTILADAIERSRHGQNKGGIQQTDTFTTLTTQSDSLSTCSSTSLSIARSLTETTNNTFEHKVRNDEKLDIFKLIENGSNESNPLSESFKDGTGTPPRRNGSLDIVELTAEDSVSVIESLQKYVKTPPPKECPKTPPRSTGPSRQIDLE